MADGVPKYIAVRDNLRQRIDSMAPDEQLPPEVELCKQYNVSRITLRHAVDNLILEGLLVREQGRGTFRAKGIIYSHNREVISDRVQGFYRQSGEDNNSATYKVLENDVVNDADAASRLVLDSDTDLICLKRICYMDGVLSRYSAIYLNASRFPKILTNDFSTGSLSSFLFKTYAVSLTENEISIHVEKVCSRMAAVLEVQEGTPVLVAQSTVKDKFGSIVAFGIAVYSPSYGDIKFHLHSTSE